MEFLSPEMNLGRSWTTWTHADSVGTHKSCKGSSQEHQHREGRSDRGLPAPKQEDMCNQYTLAKGQSVFSNVASLGLSITRQGRPYAHELLANTKSTQWYLCGLFVSFCFILPFFSFLVLILDLIVWFPLFFFCFLTFCFCFMKERVKRTWGWMSRVVGRIWEDLEGGKENMIKTY